MNISNILNGWQNFITKSEVAKETARERAKYCVVCPNAKKGMLTAFIKDELKEVEGVYCNVCGCPLSAKLRSEKETCPKKLW